MYDIIWSSVLCAGEFPVQWSRFARWPSSHERLRLPHLQNGQCWWRGCLLQVPLQGRFEFNFIEILPPEIVIAYFMFHVMFFRLIKELRICWWRRQTAWQPPTQIMLLETCLIPSPMATSHPGPSTSRLWPLRRLRSSSSIPSISLRYYVLPSRTIGVKVIKTCGCKNIPISITF